MPGADVEPRPAWEIVLSHHLEGRLDRTFRLPLSRRGIRVCARCTGQLVGAVAWLAVLGATLAFRADLFVLPMQAAFAVFPAVAAVDWLSQSTGRREATNGFRLVSGALLGFASIDVLGALGTRHWLVVLGGLGIFATYVLVVGIVLRATGAWRRVVEEHFPGVRPDFAEGGDAPAAPSGERPRSG